MLMDYSDMLGVSEIRNMQMRDAFISKLYEKVKHDKDIVIISNDLHNFPWEWSIPRPGRP